MCVFKLLLSENIVFQRLLGCSNLEIFTQLTALLSLDENDDADDYEDENNYGAQCPPEPHKVRFIRRIRC